jgi:hypothetical protein
MKKSDWKYLVNTLLFFYLSGMAFTGILQGLVLPEGPVSPESSKYFLGLHRHQWGAIHSWLALSFTLLLLVLNWDWILAKARTLFEKRAGAVLGLTFVFSLVPILIFWMASGKNLSTYENYGRGSGERAKVTGLAPDDSPTQITKREPPEADPGSGQAAPEKRTASTLPRELEIPLGTEMETDEHRIVNNLTITGQTTLRQIEESLGIPATTILERLHLPQGVSSQETLGKLRRIYGFQIQDVRDVIASALKEKRRQSSASAK